MAISSIKINNLLSFDHVEVQSFKDMNCFVGMNNVGKSNFLKLIQFFYDTLEKKRLLSPSLNNNYNNFGTISITFNMREIKKIVTNSDNNTKSKIFPLIRSTFFSKEGVYSNEYTLTLYVYQNRSTSWSTNDLQALKFLNYLYPFFYINTRDIVLHDWQYIWEMISRIKTYKTKNIKQNDYLDFLDSQILEGKKGRSKFSQDIKRIENIIENNGLGLTSFSHNEKIINYIKSSLIGHTFNYNGEEITIQSDGTNSSNYLQIFISLLLSLSKPEYIIPTLYVDEPEIGLHTKKAEEFVYNIFDLYNELKRNNSKKQFPHIVFSTHSPSILKMVIKLFEENQQVIHFSKKIRSKDELNKTIINTKINRLKSIFTGKDGEKFLNRFTDVEAKLFFSKFILFVEGESEVELFNLKKLIYYFPILKHIDIYPSSDNIKIKHINPSYSNSTIPYFILYDFDKIVDIRKIDKKKEDKYFVLKNSFFDFKAKSEEYKKCFPKEKFYTVKTSSKRIYIDYLTNRNKYNFSIKFKDDYRIDNLVFDREIRFGIHKFKNQYKSYVSIMKKFLKTENILVNSKTLENVIINDININIFMEWLFYELESKTFFKNKSSLEQVEQARKQVDKDIEYNKFFTSIVKEISKKQREQTMVLKIFLKFRHNNKRIKYYKNNKTKEKYQETKKIREELNKVSKSLKNTYINKFKCSFEHLGNNTENLTLSKNEVDILYSAKKEAIKLIKIDLLNLKNKYGVEFFTIIIELLFNGKTETMLKKDVLKKDKKLKMDFITIENHLSLLTYLLNRKTSNWISTFMNYYFKNKENEFINNLEKDDLIKEKFEKDFKDLYDIIKSISLRLVV